MVAQLQEHGQWNDTVPSDLRILHELFEDFKTISESSWEQFARDVWSTGSMKGS